MLSLLTDPPNRINVLGVGISILNLERAVQQIIAAAQRKNFSGYVTVTGVHGVVESQRDPELKCIHNRSFLSTPDGMPMVWLGKWSGYKDMGRVYGPDLMLTICEATATENEGHFLYGGVEGVAQNLATQLVKNFPGISISGTHTPPFRRLTEEEEQSLYKELKKTKPRYIWVGLGTPKQEKFMHDFLAKYPDLTKDWNHGLVMLGVGAAFDFHTERILQAPRWIQNAGFEWLFRILIEPKRLWKRYAYSIGYFIKNIIPQMMGLKVYEMPQRLHVSD